MAHRMPEGGGRLAGKRAPRTIGDGARDHQRQAGAALGELLEAGEDRGLGVQGVENGLDEENVRAAIDEPLDLLAIGDAEFVEADRAEAWIVDVGRERGGPVRGPERAGHETAPSVSLLRPDRGAARQSRAIAIELVDDILHSVVGLSDRGRGKRVGLEDVGAGKRVSEMDVLDRLWLAEGQKIVVALQGAVAGVKARAAKVGLAEAEALDLGAHRPVNQQDPVARGAAEGRQWILPKRKRRVGGWIEVTIHSADRQCRYCRAT